MTQPTTGDAAIIKDALGHLDRIYKAKYKAACEAVDRLDAQLEAELKWRRDNDGD